MKMRSSRIIPILSSVFLFAAGAAPAPDQAGTPATLTFAARGKNAAHPRGQNTWASDPTIGAQADKIFSQPPLSAAVTMKFDPLPALSELPQPLPKLMLPESATMAQLDEEKKQREAALESIRQTDAAADAAHQEAVRRLEAAKLEKEKRQKELAAKRKALAPVFQEAATTEAERRKLEKETVKLQMAAAEAARQAEAAKRKLDDAVAKSGEKVKASQQAGGELNVATAELASLGRELDDLSQWLTKADALRQQARLSQQQAEQDLEKIASSAGQILRAEREGKRQAIQEKIAAIESQVQALQAQGARFDSTLGPLRELGVAGTEAIKKIEEKQGAINRQISELQTEAKRLSAEAGDLPGSGAANFPGTPPGVARTDKNPALPPGFTAAANSLGMKFATAGDVQFSIYLTTRKNFEAFAAATHLKSDAWRNPGFQQDPDHPVVNVTWREAEAFCKWLTEKERKSGLLKTGQSYRLPTDVEWSKAVGLPAETGATPEERDMKVQDVYPWGSQWPPPAGAGNYAGGETRADIAILNYNDGYAHTSPVGKFRVNAFGLSDMGGNVWQWVGDFWNSENRAKVLRGGSWDNGAIPLSLLSSCRISSPPDTMHDTYGFRIVKSVEAGKVHHRKANN